MKTLTIIFCALCAAISTVQAGKGPTTDRAEESETRVYDVRDFIIELRDFPFEGVMGLPKESPEFPVTEEPKPEKKRAASKPSFSRQAQIEAIMSLIQETVDPDSWRGNGGTEGQIREIAGMLIVTQTEENQKLIQNIFGQLRENEGVVRLQADWVLLRPDQLAAVMRKVAGKDKKHIEARAVDMEALAAASVPRMHAELSCFSSQQVSMSSGRTRTVIYDQEAVVAQNAVAMNPRVKQVSDGAMLEITPTVITSTDFAIVEVHSKVAQWAEPTSVAQGMSASTTRPGDRAITGVADSAVIEKLNVACQELRASTRIPLNQPILMGGMTLEPGQYDGQSPQMYLILTVSLTGAVGS